MSSGPQHYRQAEKHLGYVENAANMLRGTRSDHPNRLNPDAVMAVCQIDLALANAHATLALAACQSTRITDHWVEVDEQDAREWIEATKDKP